jgi:hypothetical protein
MTGSTAKAMTSSKNIGVILTITLANIYGADATKIGNIVLIILFTFDNIFKLDHDTIRSGISRMK